MEVGQEITFGFNRKMKIIKIENINNNSQIKCFIWLIGSRGGKARATVSHTGKIRMI